MGSYKSSNEVYNTIILAGRRYLQEVDNLLGQAHQVYVKIEDADDAGAVIASIDDRVREEFPYETTTKDQRSFMTEAVEDLREIVGFSHWVILITLGVVLVSVANTVSMGTRDRIQEFGVVRSLGFRRGQVLWLVLAESLLLGLVGGGLGLLGTMAVLNLGDVYYGILGLNIRIHVTPDVIASALGISLLVGALGGLLPAFGASRLKIVESLRNVD